MYYWYFSISLTLNKKRQDLCSQKQNSIAAQSQMSYFRIAQYPNLRYGAESTFTQKPQITKDKKLTMKTTASRIVSSFQRLEMKEKIHICLEGARWRREYKNVCENKETDVKRKNDTDDLWYLAPLRMKSTTMRSGFYLQNTQSIQLITSTNMHTNDRKWFLSTKEWIQWFIDKCVGAHSTSWNCTSSCFGKRIFVRRKNVRKWFDAHQTHQNPGRRTNSKKTNQLLNSLSKKTRIAS